MEPKCKLKYIFFLFYIPLIHKSIKYIRKTSFWFKDIVNFIISVYNWAVFISKINLRIFIRRFGPETLFCDIFFSRLS